jgi:bifunctional N-acetylglucosamine-1-phosphate-uridyltransferase/glucosamine-1-phosphate-acetyltransferase GlmU-like protein
VITKDVPADALALGRAEQTEKLGWAKARRDLLEKRKK